MLDLTWVQRSPADINVAVTAALATKRERLIQVKTIAAAERTFTNTIEVLERSSDELNDLHQQLLLLLNVHPDENIRDACQAASARIEAAVVELEYDRDIYRAVQQWQEHAETDLDAEQQKLVDDTVRDMRRMGFALPDTEFAELKQLRTELQQLEQAFERAINDHDDHILVTRGELAGLPERYIERLRNDENGKYIVSLQYPEFFPFMNMAQSDTAREQLATKELRKGGPENLERLAHIITLRQKIAGLLGYRTHAEFVQEMHMTETAATVEQFLLDTIRRLAPVAQRDFRDLIEIKKKTLGLEHPAPIHFHEIPYWSHKLKAERFAFDPEQAKEYFPLATVLKGMFEIYQSLLGVRFEKISAEGWHENVEYYAMQDISSGKLLGHFALDLYPRVGKYGHAMAVPVTLGRQTHDGGVVPGFFVLICNFTQPTPIDPSLMSHDDAGVETLLHEFGHVMHGLLSGRRWQRQNGFGVAGDFVEALSQIFEYWVWDERSLAKLSGHYQTGQPIPVELLQKLLAARNHQQARGYRVQAVRSLYDLIIHNQQPNTVVSGAHLAKLYRDMRLDYDGVDLPESSLFPAGWSHMADYDARYYGYLWSKVYAADMFTRFTHNPLDPVIGHRYREYVLAPGASCKERDMVQAFLERPSNSDAFLAELGIQ